MILKNINIKKLLKYIIFGVVAIAFWFFSLYFVAYLGLYGDLSTLSLSLGGYFTSILISVLLGVSIYFISRKVILPIVIMLISATPAVCVYLNCSKHYTLFPLLPVFIDDYGRFFFFIFAGTVLLSKTVDLIIKLIKKKRASIEKT